SLRRTLLSSIPGAAITHVRFDTELHEFAPIKGITEDATDILLNLKDLVLVVHTDDPVQLRLDVKGGGPEHEVTAGDIEPNPDVEIINPEMHIATLNGNGRLSLDITVAKGRGYVSEDRNKRGTAPIGEIALDSVFSPVRRVAFV